MRVALSFLFIGLMAFAWPATARAADPAQVAKVCAEADERYTELFGDQPAEDGVLVIKMYKYTFCPIDPEVKVGTTLRWVNVDKRTSHSVWFKEQGKPESERLFSEEAIEMVMDEVGTFNYVCGPHEEQEGMQATVTVIP